MRLALVHNESAGHELYETRHLVGLLRDAGHDVEAFDNEDGTVDDAIRIGADVVVAAGGDGTVAKVAIAMHKALARGALYILPLGTSNNIARTLGIGHTVPQLIESLPRARSSRFDIGVVTAPWGRKHFVEAAGFGFIGRMLERDRSLRAKVARAVRPVRDFINPELTDLDHASRGVADLVREEWVRRCRVRADGDDLTGEYLAVEVMNIRDIGPRVTLAPNAHPGDEMLDLLLVRPEDCEALADYVESRGTTAATPAGIARRVRRVEITWPSAGGHVDDEPWPGDDRAADHDEPVVTIELAGAVTVLLAQ